MDRKALEKATITQLKLKAGRYKIPVTDDKTKLIEAILEQRERISEIQRPGTSGQLIDLAQPTQAAKTVKAKGGQGQGASATGARVESRVAVEQPLTPSLFMETMNGFATMLAEKMAELIKSNNNNGTELSRRSIEERREVETEPMINRAGSSARSQAWTEEDGMRQTNGFSGGPAIQWLASQIPEFGGTEDENIHTWVRRVDHVVRVHGATNGVILLAASSKLTKVARQ